MCSSDLIASLDEQVKGLSDKWQEEKKSLDHIKELKDQKVRLEALKEKYQTEGNLEEASKIKYQTLPQIEKEISQKISEVNKVMPRYKAIRGTIISDVPLIKTTTNKIKREKNLELIKKEFDKFE